MLVLSRKYLESVLVRSSDGSECLLKVTVAGIRGNRVTLGFEAAEGLSILRTELWDPEPAGGQPGDRETAAEEAIEQWDNDGGAAA